MVLGKTDLSTVLLDFHGSNDKTGLGEKVKTRVGKSLKLCTAVLTQHQITSMLCIWEPAKHLEGLRTGGTHIANIFPYLPFSH